MHGNKSTVEDVDVMESLFVFALIWSVGASIIDGDRPRFDQFVKQLSQKTLVNVAGKNKLPKDETLFDYYFDLIKRMPMQWTPWSKQVTEYVPPQPFEFSKVIVSTIDTVRNRYFLHHLTQSGNNILFVGESGTAKTNTIQNYLLHIDREKYSAVNINFSSRTTSLNVQKTLMDNIEKRGPVWSPLNGKKLLVFVDDLNMPQVDTYGTQQPIALLKFLTERNMMYEREGDLEAIHTKSLFWIAAMLPPGRGRNYVDPRFVSLFATFNVIFPSKDSLLRIYSSILKCHTEQFNGEVQMAASQLTPMTMSFYQSITERLPPTPSKFHYCNEAASLLTHKQKKKGLCQSLPSKYTTSSSFVRLWRNEILRVFGDRMNVQEDKDLLEKNLLPALLQQFFNTDPTLQTSVLKTPILFGSFEQNNSDTIAMYQDLKDYSNVKMVFEEVLRKYNLENNGNKIRLVLFEDALEHIVRIHRILKLPRGNALLVGVGGSGKQSLTKLATFCCNYDLFEIKLTRNYCEHDFREDLKKLYQKLGTGKDCTFLFTDAQVATSRFWN
ncbi:hypothetical protein RFI_17115 [Reticulomyxa filosa]|uniref:Uncharacterized protein n=1 Tax=Reticulomyxa filosa TaxID=46433 RepID=X6N1E6_RETFI|nr:hypothetical protein RFI_17115 [Reticulomyxa filosa]|eukprot:ETO20100.1 hypothetical protein RFI_17115 [Reticulomyxa filosa]